MRSTHTICVLLLLVGLFAAGHLAVCQVPPGYEVFDVDGGLWIQNMDTTNGRWLLAPGGGNHSPALSPDGLFVAWVSDCNPYRDPECVDEDIMLMAIDGAGGYAPDVGLYALTLPGHQYDPAWTPNGDLVFFDDDSQTIFVVPMEYDPWYPHWKHALQPAPAPLGVPAVLMMSHANGYILHIDASDDRWHSTGLLFDPTVDTATVYIGGKPCQQDGDPSTCGLEHLLVAVRLRNDPNSEVVLRMGQELRWRYRDPGGLEFAWTQLGVVSLPTSDPSVAFPGCLGPGVLEFRIEDPDGDYTNNAGTIVDGYVITVVM